MNIPNSAVDTMHVVDATDRANTQLAARQAQEVRPLLWSDLPAEVPDGVMAILRHHLLPPLLRYGLVTNPKDTAALDEQVTRAFRIAHRFSRDPWAGQQRLMQEEGLTTDRVLALNGAIRESDFMQDLIVRQGVAKKYWSTILPLVETGSVEAVLNNTYQFPVRLGIYAAVYCMFSCSFCGRMKNPGARYSYDDVEPGNGLFDAIFSAMPRGISTLSLGGGLEPLTNTKIDDVVHSAKRYGHKVPLVTNAFMLTPAYVRRHPGLWDVDVLRVSLYGVDEPSYLAVTNKPGAFPVVKNNVIEFLRERRRRGGGPRFGFNFIVLVDSTDQVLRVLDLICEINEAVGAPAVDFLTLREDFSIAEGEGLTPEERRDLVAIFREFNQRRRRECPELNVDFGYALYPLSEGVEWPGLAMVAHQGMLPKAYPQVSVALDLLGDVYLYRDAAFPERPCSDRYMIGTITKDRPLETVVAEFIESGREIPAHPDDPGLMDAFDHVVTKLIWQLQGDRQAGVPFGFGPVRYGTRARAAGAGPAVNYWQNLFGA